jgi:Zn finger protein HypA/HybF involved in hydrogenase expression
VAIRVIKDLMKKNNWKVRQEKQRAYGKHNGYYFTAYWNNYQTIVSVSLPHLDETQKVQILEDLNRHKEELRISDVSLDDGVLTATFKEVLRSLKYDDIIKYLDHASKLFMELKIPETGKCFKCGREEDTESVLYNDIPVSICPYCYEEAKSISKQNEEEYANTKKNYIPGFAGAFIGSIIGSIPWIIASYAGWFAAIFGFVIGKVSLKGYKLTGGKTSKATWWIIMGCTVFGILFAEVVDYTIAVINYYEIPFSMNIIYIIISTPEILRDIAPNFAIGLIMGILGVSSLFKEIRQEFNAAVLRVEKI